MLFYHFLCVAFPLYSILFVNKGCLLVKVLSNRNRIFNLAIVGGIDLKSMQLMSYLTNEKPKPCFVPLQSRQEGEEFM